MHQPPAQNSQLREESAKLQHSLAVVKQMKNMFARALQEKQQAEKSRLLFNNASPVFHGSADTLSLKAKLPLAAGLEKKTCGI